MKKSDNFADKHRLYDSAVSAFNFIDNFLQKGTLLYLDDLFAGYNGNPYNSVGKAFLEYQKNSQWQFVKHLDIGWWGRSYIVIKKQDYLHGTL